MFRDQTGGVNMTEEWLKQFVEAADRLHLAEYVRFQSDRKRRLWDAFLQGVMRGLGLVVGFAVLGTLLIMILKNLAQHNLPVISDFLAQVITMVEMRIR